MSGDDGYDRLNGGAGSDTLTGGEGNDRFEFDVFTSKNFYLGKYQSWMDSKNEDSVDVVTDFTKGYYLDENDTLVFNVDSLEFNRHDQHQGDEMVVREGEMLVDGFGFYDHSIDTAADLDKYVIVREVGPTGTDVAIWFDSQGFDRDFSPNPDDARTPNEDIIILQGIGSGQGKINSLEDLVKANYNVEVNDVQKHYNPEWDCCDYGHDYVIS